MKLLVIGTGGVGSAFAAIARRRTFFDACALADYDHGPRFPAPCLGEHTYQVLSEVLRLDDDEIARVMGSGACG